VSDAGSIALAVVMMDASSTLRGDGVVWLGRRGVMDLVAECWNSVDPAIGS
jgi:hypothetical protein